MTDLLGAIRGESSVAVSRLADDHHLRLLRTTELLVVEVPHIGGIPIDVNVGHETMRIRYWPNLAGHLEIGGDEDIVVWWPSLASDPHARSVVTAGPPAVRDTARRTTFLRRLFAALEQFRGISRVRHPEAARGIVHTPGVGVEDLTAAAHQYPDAIHATPKRLPEFPGGLGITVTDQVWNEQDGFIESITELIDRTCNSAAAQTRGHA